MVYINNIYTGLLVFPFIAFFMVSLPCRVPQSHGNAQDLSVRDLWGSLSTGVDKLPQRSLIARAPHSSNVAISTRNILHFIPNPSE